MLATKYRPVDWEDVKGQEFVKTVLKNIVDKKSANVTILHGETGLGKTTLARIFSNKLNAETIEYDMSSIGNVEDLREKRDLFVSSPLDKDCFCFIFDEFHLTSKEGQAALLKVLESNVRNYFLFTTTRIDKIIEELIGRAITLELSPLKTSEIMSLVKDVYFKETGLEIGEEVLKIILRRANGHARNALMLLDTYIMSGEEVFKEFKGLLDSKIKSFIKRLLSKDFDGINIDIESLCRNNISFLEEDFNVYIQIICDNLYLKQDFKYAPFENIVNLYFKNRVYLTTNTSWYVFFSLCVKEYSKGEQA